MPKLNIKDLDRVELLKSMGRTSKSKFFTFNLVAAPVFDQEEAKKAIKNHIDYFCGRAIKTDISKDEINTYLYNRDAGAGKFESIVKSMRTKSAPSSA